MAALGASFFRTRQLGGQVQNADTSARVEAIARNTNGVRRCYQRSARSFFPELGETLSPMTAFTSKSSKRLRSGPSGRDGSVVLRLGVLKRFMKGPLVTQVTQLSSAQTNKIVILGRESHNLKKNGRVCTVQIIG